MRTTIDIPDETYKNIKRMAQSQPRRMRFPVIRSTRPGTLDLDNEKIYDIIGFP